MTRLRLPTVLLALLAVICAQTGSTRQALRFVSGAIPNYPPVAWTAHISGTVRLEATVDNGEVVDVRVLASPSEALSAPSKENLRTWTFEPQAAAAIRVTYRYRIEGSPTAVPTSPQVELDLPSLVTVTVHPFRTTKSY